MICLSNLIKADYVAMSTAYKLRMPGTEAEIEEEASDGGNISATQPQGAIQNNTVDEQQAELHQQMAQQRREAEKVLVEAKQSAEQIVQQAKQEAAALRQEAVDKIEQERQQTLAAAQEKGHKDGQRLGYTEGYEEGIQHARAENRRIGDSLQAALEHFELEKQKMLAQNLDDLKYLALEVASKIVQRQLLDDKGLYLGMIRSALNTFKEYHWVDIYLSDEEGVSVYLEQNLAQEIASHSEYINIRTKGELPKGSCIVETDAGVVDVSVDTQLKQIEQLFEMEGTN